MNTLFFDGYSMSKLTVLTLNSISEGRSDQMLKAFWEVELPNTLILAKSNSH